MANDEYQIPNNYSEPEIRAQIDAIEEYVQPSPEKEVTPFQHVKEVEARVFAHREAALAKEKRPKAWLNGLVFKPQNNTLHDLIEKESEVGGALFGKGNKFWLDAKSNNTVFHNDVADWYHVQPNPLKPKELKPIHIQTTPYSIHKLYNGREYTPTPQDISIFFQAVDAYADAIDILYDDAL